MSRDASGALSFGSSGRVPRAATESTDGALGWARSLVVHISVEPDARNRSLEVISDGAGFCGSSVIPLDGDRIRWADQKTTSPALGSRLAFTSSAATAAA
jgi:hypothetical protein